MLKIELPKELEEEYYAINREFSKIENDWKKYNDRIIPEEPEYAKRIIRFLINVIDYIQNNYERLDIKKYQEFLAYYKFNFKYGWGDDERYYLDFDENIDGEPVTEICFPLLDEDFDLTKEILEEIKNKYKKILKMFN